MFWPMSFTPSETETTCPNCGDKEWPKSNKDKAKRECQKCGYKNVESKVLDPITLTYCEGCGCTLSSPCTTHPASKQKKV